MPAICDELTHDAIEINKSGAIQTNTDISPQIFRETVGFAKAEEY